MATADLAEADSDIYLPLRFGDPGALELAYNRYGGLAYGLSLRIVSDTGDAEEVVQEVFLRIWKSPYSFDPSRGSFRTWLLTLIRNRSIDRLRARHRMPAGAELPVHLEDHSTHSDPWQTLALGLERDAVRKGLDTLPVEQREAIEMAFLSGYTHTEIAERLGLPLGTVKGRLRLGLEKLHGFFATTGLVTR
ncbi:MAG TPA: sigma-70 family RNA polymerase sigma factor [Candidatus Solibacter sp.]|jgi:RNA polymerase sigma-70 factor (ECF subfamily)|nr:sigma-70 family RNA polymerase sigma factor [Candidatus Solibacter sp.]